MLRQMVSPILSPALCVLKNSAKIRGMMSLGIPPPGSAMASFTLSSVA